jgi:hypothetical protein
MSDQQPNTALHIGPFLVAMVAGPLLVTVCTFWLMYIPVYALIFGGIPYLVIGLPIAVLMSRTGPVNVERALAWSGLTIVIITAVATLPAAILGEQDSVWFVLAFGGVSIIFGAAWAATSAWVYGQMTRAPATNTLP